MLIGAHQPYGAQKHDRYAQGSVPAWVPPRSRKSRDETRSAPESCASLMRAGGARGEKGREGRRLPRQSASRQEKSHRPWTERAVAAAVDLPASERGGGGKRADAVRSGGTKLPTATPGHQVDSSGKHREAARRSPGRTGPRQLAADSHSHTTPSPHSPPGAHSQCRELLEPCSRSGGARQTIYDHASFGSDVAPLPRPAVFSFTLSSTGIPTTSTGGVGSR